MAEYHGSDKKIGYNHEIATYIANDKRESFTVYEFIRGLNKFQRITQSEWLASANRLSRVSATAKAKLNKKYGK